MVGILFAHWRKLDYSEKEKCSRCPERRNSTALGIHTLESRSKHNFSSDSAALASETKVSNCSQAQALKLLSLVYRRLWPAGQIHSFYFPSVYIFQVFLINSKTIWLCHRNGSHAFLFAIVLFLNKSLGFSFSLGSGWPLSFAQGLIMICGCMNIRKEWKRGRDAMSRTCLVG